MFVIKKMRLNRLLNQKPKRNRDLFLEFGARYDPKGEYSFNNLDDLPNQPVESSFTPTLGDNTNYVAHEVKQGIIDVLYDFGSKNPSKKDEVSKVIDNL